MEIVPGLTIHEHEGHLSGTFELSNADLAAIRWDGRVMLAVVVDIVAPFRITTTKDGTNLAHWTFKAVDVAFVRDESMRKHIAEVVHIDGIGTVDPHPLDAKDQPPRLALEGVYDNEGTFIGMEPVGADGGAWSPSAEDLASMSKTVTAGKAAGDGALRDSIVPEEEPRTPLFTSVSVPSEFIEEREKVEVFGAPITHGKDSTLDRFLNE